MAWTASALTVASIALVVAVGGTSDDRAPTRAGSHGTLFVQLLRDGEPLVAIDLPAGEPRIVRGLALAGGDPLFRLVRTGGRLVYNGAGGTYAIDLDLEGGPQKLAEAWYFVPSATAGRVWLTFLDRDSPATVNDLRSVAEMTVRGEVTARSPGPPPCRGPTVVAATTAALLCQGRNGMRAFDPASGEVLARIPGPFPLDTYGGLVAWCAQRCPRLHVTDVKTGRDTVVRPAEGSSFEDTYEGPFSPDGSLLAAPVLTGGRARQVALVDVDEGTATIIRGSRLSGYRNMTWASSGLLYFEAGRGRVMAYRPGWERATLLPFRLGAQILDMAAS
jgi:hypothetical protein